MNDDFSEFIVTEDSDLLDQLWVKFSELGTFEVAAYAFSLGLYPPGYEEGQTHSITACTPAGHEGRPYLVWSVGLDSPGADDQEPEEYEDGEDPWADVLEITTASGPASEGPASDTSTDEKRSDQT